MKEEPRPADRARFWMTFVVPAAVFVLSWWVTGSLPRDAATNQTLAPVRFALAHYAPLLGVVSIVLWLLWNRVPRWWLVCLPALGMWLINFVSFAIFDPAVAKDSAAEADRWYGDLIAAWLYTSFLIVPTLVVCEVLARTLGVAKWTGRPTDGSPQI